MPRGQPQHEVFIVSSDARWVSEMERLFASSPVRLVTATGVGEAVKAVLSDRAQLVIFEAPTQGMNPAQGLRLLRGLDPRRYVPVIIATDGATEAEHAEWFELGADAVVARSPGPLLGVQARRLLQVRSGIVRLGEELQSLQLLSVTDGLTQLFNHRFFQERLREEFRRAQRYDDLLALVLLDVDHFKKVNDSWGHPAGDQVLKDVAAALRRSVRETDLVCRYGGEEFAAILPKTPVTGALTVAERIWRDLGNTRVGPGLRITGSLGVAGYPGREISSAESLLHAADQALYRAKSEGRNRVCLHAPSRGDLSVKSG